MEADPGGTYEVATPHSAAAAGEVLVPATDEVAAQEPKEPEEPEDLWGDREAERGAEESAVQDEPGVEDEAAEHEAEAAEAAAEEGAETADGEAEPAEEEAAEEEAVEEETAKEHGALGGDSGSEDEDEDEVSDDDEPCTVSYPAPPLVCALLACARTDGHRASRASQAEQQDVAKKAKGVVKEALKEALPTKPLQGRSSAKVGAKPGRARSSAKVIKRPNTGFQLFSFEKRAEVSEQLPGGDSKEVMKLLSETWKEAPSAPLTPAPPEPLPHSYHPLPPLTTPCHPLPPLAAPYHPLPPLAIPYSCAPPRGSSTMSGRRACRPWARRCSRGA